MKKVVSFLIGLTMLFTTAFAGSAEIIADALNKTSKLTSCSGEMTFSAKLNEPLYLLETIQFDEDIPIDIKLLVEELIGATAKIDYSYSTSDDYKKMDIYMGIAYDTPLVLSEDFRLEAWAKTLIWMSYDVTDEENPVYKMIVKVPLVNKYQIYDLSDFLKSSPSLMVVFDKDIMEDFQKKITDALLQKANITTSGNNYTLSLDDKGAKEYLIEVLKVYKEYMEESSFLNYESVAMVQNIFDQAAEFFEKTTLLGENGLEITFSKHEEGIITAEAEELHIRFNVFDILEAYEQSTEGLGREEAYVDITLQTELTTSNHNKAEVVMPELTEENSEYVDMYYEFSNIYIISDEAPVFKSNYIYYPIESIALQDGLDLTTAINDDEISITYPDGQIVNVRGNTANLYGEYVTYDMPPVIVENDMIYCIEAFIYPLNIIQVGTYYDFDSGMFKFKYCYEIPEDVSESDENTYDSEPYDYQEYIPPTLYYTFYIPRGAYTNDGVVYMPVYEFVQLLFPGEFTFEENSLTYTALEENKFDIQTIKVSDGDLFVTIDGVERPLEAAAKEVEGVLNIPVSFTKELGIDEGYIQVRYNAGGRIHTTYSFNMPNPDYVEPNYNDYVPYMLYVWVNSDRVPYVENGEVYVPAYDLFEGMFKGEFSFKENGMEYVATRENSYGIEKVSIYVGDNFVTVDDQKIEFDNKVVTVDDIIRVPISFIEKLGMTVTSIKSYDSSTTYQFEMENPNYVEKEINNESTELYNNWFYKLFQ